MSPFSSRRRRREAWRRSRPIREPAPTRSSSSSAVKDISRRQGDNNGGLAERGALAVPHILPPAGAKPEAPAPQLVSNKPLTGKERKKLTHDLPDRYRQFLEDVEPILTDVERDTLLKLGEDYQRDHFIEEFWKRRSLAPDGIRIAFRDIYEMRLQQAKERFRNINTDMGRIFVVNGPPDGVRKIDCQDVYWPIQIWYYERLESLRLSKVLLLFYQQFGTGDYRLWTPLDGPQAVVAGGLPGMTGCRAARGLRPLPGSAGRAGRAQHGLRHVRADRLVEARRRPPPGPEARRRGRGPHPPDDHGPAGGRGDAPRAARLPVPGGDRQQDPPRARGAPRARLAHEKADRRGDVLRRRRRRGGRARRPPHRQLPLPVRLPGLHDPRTVRAAHDRARPVSGRVPPEGEGRRRQPQLVRAHQREAQGSRHARFHAHAGGEGRARGREEGRHRARREQRTEGLALASSPSPARSRQASSGSRRAPRRTTSRSPSST